MAGKGNLRYSPLDYNRRTNSFDFGGAQLTKYADHRPGLKFYVNVNITTPGYGQTWDQAFDSLNSCLTYIKANYSSTERRDATIYMAPGDYNEGATVAVDIRGLSIIGGGDDNRNMAMIYDAGSLGYHLMTINAHEVTIDGIAFCAAADTYDGIRVSTTMSAYKVCIRNCHLNGWSGEYGIHTGTTYDSPDILVENNLFRGWNTACIYSNATRGVYRDNIFHVVSAKYGINHIPSGGNRPDNVYIRNYFSGVTNTTTTGIYMTGTPTNGYCIMAHNIFCGSFDTTITQTAATVACENYSSDNAGGALVDATS